VVDSILFLEFFKSYFTSCHSDTSKNTSKEFFSLSNLVESVPLATFKLPPLLQFFDSLQYSLIFQALAKVYEENYKRETPVEINGNFNLSVGRMKI
jgi:hypothetical protein